MVTAVGMTTPTTVHSLCLDLARESTSRVERYLLLSIADRAEARQIARDTEERRVLTAEARRHERKSAALIDRSTLVSTITALVGHWYANRAAAKPTASTAPAN